jgi:hypothetical protein
MCAQQACPESGPHHVLHSEVGRSSLRQSADAASRPHLDIRLGSAAVVDGQPAAQGPSGQPQGLGSGHGRGPIAAVQPQQGDDIEWI